MKLNLDYITGLLESKKVENGLYIVATPIGNLSDITINSLKILSSVDLIICEDTRSSKKLTSKYGIKTPLKPFHKFNSFKSIPSLIKKLKTGISVALISDSGTPIISDPGSDLVHSCDLNNIKVFSLPGPSAPIASLVLSNFSKTSFSFRGFFPRQKKNALKEIELLNRSDCPVIYFESPKRIIKTLEFVKVYLGECNITFVRELTKKHEEVINSSIADLIKVLKIKQKILGEITIVIEQSKNQYVTEISPEEILSLSYKLMNDGLNISEISKKISNDLKISKRMVYQLLIKKNNYK